MSAAVAENYSPYTQQIPENPYRHGYQQAGAASMQPPEVDVVTVAKGAVQLPQDIPGRLEAYRTSQVRAQQQREEGRDQ